VDKLYDAALRHHKPNPDFGAIYDEMFPGRRDRPDSNARRQVIQEVAEDAHARGAEEDAEEAEVSADEDSADPSDMRDPAKRRAEIEAIAQAHIDAPEGEAA
jgi:hypothetical protein